MKVRLYSAQTYCTLLLLLLAGSPLLAQETAIFAAEAARFQAQIEKDTEALQGLLDDDLYYLHSNGLVETKADFLTSVAGGKIVYLEMTPTEQHLRLYGRTAVLYGLVVVRGEYQGTAFDIGLHYTSVYRKKRGQWRLLNWQSTKKT